MKVTFFNVSSMVRVAITATLQEQGRWDPELVDAPVELVGCHDPSGWARMEEDHPPSWRAVALLDEMLPYQVYRAMVLGQSVASSRWDPVRVTEVILARHHGHLSLPASHVRLAMERLPVPLSSSEVGVLPHLASGMSPSQVSARTHFSERHVRRLRASILAKSGTDDIGSLWAGRSSGSPALS